MTKYAAPIARPFLAIPTRREKTELQKKYQWTLFGTIRSLFQ